MKDLDYGKGYRYAHDFEKNFVEQEFLPEGITGQQFFEPSDNPPEQRIRQWLRERWKEKYGY